MTETSGSDDAAYSDRDSSDNTERYRRNQNERVEELLSSIERMDLDPGPRDPREIADIGVPSYSDECDYCSRAIEIANPDNSHYFASKDIFGNSAPKGFHQLMAMATYCHRCNRTEVRLPCRGFTEVLVRGPIDPETETFPDGSLRLTDFSAKSTGIPWNPLEVRTTITGMPADEFQEHSRQTGWIYGPEDVYNDMKTSDVHLEDLIDVETGELIQSKVADAKQTHQQNLLEMASDRSREAFSDRAIKYDRQYRDRDNS